MLANVLAEKAKKRRHRKDFDRKGRTLNDVGRNSKENEKSQRLAEKRSQNLLGKKQQSNVKA